MNQAPKRKTRAQKKALIVGIASSVLTLGFLIGVIISAVNIPHRTELDKEYHGNRLQSFKRIEDGYLLTATKVNKDKEVIDGFIYLYDDDNHLQYETSLFTDANTNFGISDLTTLDGCYPVQDTDSLYITSNDYLFRYTGLGSMNLTLQGYTRFDGKITTLASDYRDLYVVSKDASQYRIDRFSATDNTFEKQASGHIYEVTQKSSTYNLICSKSLFIYSTEVYGDYLYLTTSTYVRRINRQMLCNNYRILFENQLEVVKAEHPELTLDEQLELARTNCLTTYGWEDFNYDTFAMTVYKSDFDYRQYSCYILPELAGAIQYQGTYLYATKLDELATITFDELNAYGSPINYLEDNLNYHTHFKFAARLRAEVTTNALVYYGVGDTCIILYEESSSLVSVLNLKKTKIKYTLDISTRISDVFYDEKHDTLIYKYQDPVNRVSGINYLSMADVSKELKRKGIMAALFVCAIIGGIALITAIIAWISYFSRKVVKKVLSVGAGLKKHWLIYVVLFPSVFILCLFCYYPGVAAMYTSLFDYKAGISDIKTWNNFGNYAQIFTNSQSLLNFANMILFLLADVVLAIIPPLIFAFFLTLMRRKKLSGVLRTLLFIPGIIPGIAGLLIWRTGIYGDYGLINNIIKASGGEPILFFRSSDYMNIIWLILMGFPFVGSYLIFYGAMMNIPSSYYEAAELDGISIWKRFIKIDVPLCLPQIKYVLIMTIIASIQNFSRVYVAMNGTQSVVSTPIVEMYMLMNSSERNYGLASAYATILFIILFGLTYLSMRNRLKGEKNG